MSCLVSFQIACLISCIATLVTLIRLYSTVYSPMCWQSTWIRTSEFTMVAFVLLFPTVRHQMSLQIACLGGWKLIEIAPVRLFSSVSFYMCLTLADFWRFITTLLAFVFHIFWTAHLFNNKSVHPFCLSSNNKNLREYWEQNFESKSAVAGDGHDIMSRSKRNWLQQKTFIWINLKVGRLQIVTKVQ